MDFTSLARDQLQTYVRLAGASSGGLGIDIQDVIREQRIGFQALYDLCGSMCPVIPVSITRWMNPDNYTTDNSNRGIDGRLFFVSTARSVSGQNIKGAVLFVPRNYSLTSDGAHRVWLHFPPYWSALSQAIQGADPAAADRTRARYAREQREFTAWTTEGRSASGNPGFWIFKFLCDYLLWQGLLSAWTASNVPAIFAIPLYDISSGISLGRISSLPQFRRFMETALADVERSTPSVVPRASSPGRLGRIGVGCYSSGAGFLIRLLNSDRSGAVNAAAVFDGITPSVGSGTHITEWDRLYRGVLERRNPPQCRGWFGQQAGSVVPRRLVMLLQHAPMWEAFSRVAQVSSTTSGRFSFVAGPRGTADIFLIDGPRLLGLPAGTRLGFYACHERIHRSFCKYGFEYCTDALS